MELVQIYECLCDRTRLRILNLLLHGPLCVCHFQVVLGEPQVKISKHLNYLRRHGLVAARREGNWMVYALPEKISRELQANLACLQDCAREQPVFQRDLERRTRRDKKFAATSPCGCDVLCSVRPAPRRARGCAKRDQPAVLSAKAGGCALPQTSEFEP